jgi:glycosyltransferase involved in cell wall biosynthesis
MDQPLVSVIMGVYNQMDDAMMKAAVNSILNQTYKNIEFLIWDDGSCKEAATKVKALEVLDDRIHVMCCDTNNGLAYSLNECILRANGKYIARMDADDISVSTRIEKQVAFLESHPEFAWCGTNAELFDESGVWGKRPYPEIPVKKDYYKFSPFVHPSVVFRADIFDEDRGYLATEETLRCEDYEIFMHLVQRGLKGYNLQEYLFRYRETRESYRKRKAKYRINEAKTRYSLYKDMGILFPFGWLFVMRPIVACLVPASLLSVIKRSEGIINRGYEEGPAEALQLNNDKQPAALSSIATVQGIYKQISGHIG